MEANAAVTQRSRTHRVMIVGIPLLQILTERELRGVIAHEFGHYTRRRHAARPVDLPHARDDRAHDRPAQRRRRRRLLVPAARPAAVHLVRQRVPAHHGRDLAPPGVRRRRVAPSAAPAARRTSRRSGASHANAPAFDSYWMEEVVPVLDTERRPPVADGFRHFIAHEGDRGGGRGAPRARARGGQDRRLRLAPVAARADRRDRGHAGRRAGRLALLDRAPRPIPPRPSSACSTT